MDFMSSISFPNEPLISWTFLGHFCHHFWVGATAKQQQTHPKVMTKMFKKCSTDQRFIRKRNTTFKIHTLAKDPTWWSNDVGWSKSSKKILAQSQLLCSHSSPKRIWYFSVRRRRTARRRVTAVMSNSRRVPKKLCRPLPRRFTQSIKRKYYSLRALG